MKNFHYSLITLICLSSFIFRLNAHHSSLQQPTMERNTEKARENLLLLLSGEWVSRALFATAKLEIADFLKDGPRSLTEIAAFSQSNQESLQRILHMLAGFGIFEEQENGIFANNEASALLSKSNPDSLYHLATFYGEEIHTALDQILKSVNTGTPAFQLSYKQPVFTYFKELPDRAALFQKAMKEKSTAVIKSSLCAYNFGQFNSVYDIGGGYGHFLLAILKKYPQMHGVLFDIPEVINTIPISTPQILKEQCKLCPGDFFTSIPKGADAYLLKSVLHDWGDEMAGTILENCYQAMDQKSKLIIVEIVILPKDQSVYANCMDVLMLAITGGKERSLTSFSQMLDKAGFILERVYPTSTEFSILEARKK